MKKCKFQNHINFLITFIITYIISIVIWIFIYVATDKKEDLFRECLNSLIPTTITYILSSALVNILEINNFFGEKKCVCNIVMITLLTIYILVFCIFCICESSTVFNIVELCFTGFLIIFNYICYQEKFGFKSKSIC